MVMLIFYGVYIKNEVGIWISMELVEYFISKDLCCDKFVIKCNGVVFYKNGNVWNCC